jgi:hypothetical protein
LGHFDRSNFLRKGIFLFLLRQAALVLDASGPAHSRITWLILVEQSTGGMRPDASENS